MFYKMKPIQGFYSTTNNDEDLIMENYILR